MVIQRLTLMFIMDRICTQLEKLYSSYNISLQPCEEYEDEKFLSFCVQIYKKGYSDCIYHEVYVNVEDWKISDICGYQLHEIKVNSDEEFERTLTLWILKAETLFLENCPENSKISKAELHTILKNSVPYG
jgi:hypothetical protein